MTTGGEPAPRTVLEMLLADEAIDEDLVAKLLSWQHSGFSVDNQVRIEAADAQGRQEKPGSGLAVKHCWSRLQSCKAGFCHRIYG